MQKVEIYQADTGEFVIVTPQKSLQATTLETALSEVRSAFRQNKEGGQQEPCPYCGSTDTIGHGLRETGKQVLTRRFCKSCNKTWVSGREQRIAASTKEQVAFLKLMDYSETDISELVHRSKSTVRAHIENIEIAKYRAQKQAEARQELPITPSETSEAVAEKTPEISDASQILAQEFDRTKAFKESIGTFMIWSYNGRLAAAEKGKQEVIYLTKSSIHHMKMLRNGKRGKQALAEYILQIPETQRVFVSELIETFIDEDMGMFPMLRAETRVGDSGEMDARILEEGGFIGTSGSEE